jgi:hypothetical protein
MPCLGVLLASQYHHRLIIPANFSLTALFSPNRNALKMLFIKINANWNSVAHIYKWDYFSIETASVALKIPLDTANFCLFRPRSLTAALFTFGDLVAPDCH